MLKRFFNIPESYRNMLTQFEKKDAVISLIVILGYFAVMAVSGIINSYTTKLEMTVIGGIVNLMFVGIVLQVLKARGQSLISIGLKAGNVALSLKMGGFLAFILFFCNCLSNVLFENQNFISVQDILIYIVYFFTVGLSEEVLFRGFLLTRLYAVTKHVWLDVFITGVLFVLMHFPFRMIAYDRTFFELISNLGYMSDLFLTHLVLSYIRIKSDSLYGSILPHWVSDLAYSIVTHF